MKSRSGIRTVILFLLIIVIFCQSCSIYHSKQISLTEAASINRKVKVTTVSDKKYVFKRIKKDEDVIYGTTGKNSKAAKDLMDNIIEDKFDDNRVRISLTDDLVKEINPKNNALSIIVPAASVIAASFFAAIVMVLSAFNYSTK